MAGVINKRPAPPGSPAESGARRRQIGIPNAFTCRFQSVRVIERFLKNAGFEVVKTPRTTPEILRAGTALCSADFCTPVRVQVGHIHQLTVDHPDLDFLLVPNLCSERPGAKNCSKYRDISGIALRSLAGTLGYVARQASPGEQQRLEDLLGKEKYAAALAAAERLPRLLQPDIVSLERSELRSVCYSLYCDILSLPRGRALLQPFVPRPLQPALAPDWRRAGHAFAEAYAAVVERAPNRVPRTLRDETKPRLAIIGRAYLHDDPLVTADLKPYFRERGVEVIAAQDVPWEALKPGYLAVKGFYETHRLYQAFLDYLGDRMDGCIVVGSFGCHPDAFENEYFLEYARARGIPAWLLKYDEQSGSAGFQTRYETILGFLEQRRDQRLSRSRPDPAPSRADSSAPPPAAPEVADALQPQFPSGPEASSPFRELFSTENRMRVDDGVRRKPAILWPHMSPSSDLVIEEVLHQAGLAEIACAPDGIREETLALGSARYTESCCPFAFTTGSLMEVIRSFFARLEAEERATGRCEPRRILLLQGRGEGPCTYGWYSQIQAIELPRLFARELARGNHTMEMATVGLAGATDLLRLLAAMGDRSRLAPIVRALDASAPPSGEGPVPALRRWALQAGLVRCIRRLTRTAWAKAYAAERLRARSLTIRAHETQRGRTTAALRRGYQLLAEAHSAAAIREAEARALALLSAVAQDDEIRPRVLVVGEIYVALASFANRGTVDNLLGREGIEVVEGITLTGFLNSSLQEMKRRALTRKPIIAPVLRYFRERNLPLLQDIRRGRQARPFALRDVGGDGIRSVAEARHAVEELGVDGIVHIYPFKCMPEMIAKTAIAEVARAYGVRYLPLSFDKEIEIERLRTEIATFAALLRLQQEKRRTGDDSTFAASRARENARRQELGRLITRMWDRQQAKRLAG
ncbi:MAG: hypothetical protein HY321_04055 [Armatimonadetes bacterium]|nr:hypothetical protein [Armatimonadota bacterium]